MPFLGTTPTQGFVGANPKQSFTANGSTTVFTLTHPVASANDLEVFVGNVRQEPTAAYSAAGTTLTMTEAPDTGLNFYVINKSQAQVTTTPPVNSISTDKIVNDAVTSAKIPSNAITTAKLANNSVTPAKKSVGILQQKEVYHTSSTQLAHGGTMSEISSSLRIAITPISASSKLIFEVNAPFVCPNSTHLQYAKIYDLTNSTTAALPPANGSRDRVHWVKRTSNFDVNDFDTLNFSVTASSDNTNARTYTVYHRTEGVTIQFLSSTLSTASGATYPFHFRITEIAQ